MAHVKNDSAAKTNASALVTTLSATDLGLTAPVPSKNAVFSTWVRVLRQNWRQGTVACKGRSDVSFSNKKPWKQKGTGRARAGSARSPIWRSGGVSFGPQPRVRKLQINKQLKKQVLLNMTSAYANNGKVQVLDWHLNQEKPSTSHAFKALKQAGLLNTTINLFLPVNDALSFASFANIPHVRILFFDQINAFDLAQAANWVILKKDADHFKTMVSQWI